VPATICLRDLDGMLYWRTRAYSVPVYDRQGDSVFDTALGGGGRTEGSPRKVDVNSGGLLLCRAPSATQPIAVAHGGNPRRKF
jgi:hypothetical protein